MTQLIPFANSFPRMSKYYEQLLSPKQREDLAIELGVSESALVRLGTGVTDFGAATAWPMRDKDGNVIGILTRAHIGSGKRMMLGSKQGLFFDPAVLRSHSLECIVVCEGATDTAALLSIGIDAVGAPSCGQCGLMLLGFCRKLNPRVIIFLADRDAHGAGSRGALKLQETLQSIAPSVVIMPPEGIKDARAWIRHGADRAAVEAVVCSAIASKQQERLTHDK